MSYQKVKIAQKSDYIKALIWFRGGTKQDAIDCYNYWSTTQGGWQMLNAYLNSYKSYIEETKI